MEQALLQLIPLGLAAALSSVPITATIFVLLSKSPGRSGLAFMAGTVLGTFAGVILATVAGQALPGRHRHQASLISTLEVVVGVAMVLLGVITLARRRGTASSGKSGWLDTIGSFGLVPVFGVGLALAIRPKGILLLTAAGLAISAGNLHFEGSLALAVVYTALATSTVIAPVVATILAPTWMEPRLLSMKSWIARNSTTVSATITVLVGAFVIYLGLTG
jgi:Sap, sulfolipid-1-addressing protein